MAGSGSNVSQSISGKLRSESESRQSNDSLDKCNSRPSRIYTGSFPVNESRDGRQNPSSNVTSGFNSKFCRFFRRQPTVASPSSDEDDLHSHSPDFLEGSMAFIEKYIPSTRPVLTKRHLTEPVMPKLSLGGEQADPSEGPQD
jgi:hypothetical protein